MGKLFYGTQTGTTTWVAEAIQRQLSDVISEVKCIQSASAAELAACDFLVLGGATWGDGELTFDWLDFWPQMDKINFSNKTVALFALGDQASYGYNFVSAMKQLYDKVKERGAKLIADVVPTVGFEFEHSEAIVDDNFVGLVIDEVNEPELTESRIRSWSALVRQELLAGVSK